MTSWSTVSVMVGLVPAILILGGTTQPRSLHREEPVVPSLSGS